LADFLNRQLEDSALAAQIPDGAHIFHGSYSDTDLTQANLKLATRILLGMTLGYVDDAPLVMIFEHKPGQQTVIDLSEELQKDKAQTFIERFQEQSRQDMVVKINEMLAA
jgi:hypothetical protein